MIIGTAPRIRQGFERAWSVLVALFFWDLAVTIFYFISPFRAPALPLTIFGTALALVLGVRVNSAYQRWWEARILWGAMVNASRSFARAVLAFLPEGEEAQALGRELVLRQVAYVHTLRRQLRRLETGGDIHRILGPGDHPELARRNPANGLLEGSGRRVAGLVRRGWIDTIQQGRIEAVLVDMANAQGGMERIKNTPLPANIVPSRNSSPGFSASCCRSGWWRRWARRRRSDRRSPASCIWRCSRSGTIWSIRSATASTTCRSTASRR